MQQMRSFQSGRYDDRFDGGEREFDLVGAPTGPDTDRALRDDEFAAHVGVVLL